METTTHPHHVKAINDTSKLHSVFVDKKYSYSLLRKLRQPQNTNTIQNR